jgi:hypothetical protein
MSHKRNPKRAIRPRWALTLVAATALIAAIAGCGESDDTETLTKAEVIDQGSAICEEAIQRVDELPQPSQHPFAKGASQAEGSRAREFLVGQADAFQSVSDGFRELDYPEAQSELLDAFIENTGTLAGQLRAASTADPQAVVPKAEQAYALFGEAGSAAAEYGFPNGACGSGNSS